MGDLEGIHQNVPFDWDTAEALVARLRSTASRLEGQIPSRDADAEDAREEWRGLYSFKFKQRVQIGASDARAIAHAMQEAALKLEELARLAREEQDRRLVARQWEEDQRNKSLGERITDGLGLTSYDDDRPPPVDYGETRRVTAEAHFPVARE